MEIYDRESIRIQKESNEWIHVKRKLNNQIYTLLSIGGQLDYIFLESLNNFIGRNMVKCKGRVE